MNGWIGVDFDGTLVQYGSWLGPEHCGEPIAPMVERVKGWLAQGREVRIFTARAWHDCTPERSMTSKLACEAIESWCREHIGQVLPITCVKDYGMIELWDDRAVQVRPNTGEVVGHSTRGLA